MKITAVIAEYNPFHNGHLKQLKKAKRETNADALVVVMSSSFTQHGDLCVEDRYTRANWAIQAGADLVLELPTVYSLSTAKGFAEGALKTLSMLGEYTLSFGTESDEIEDLNMAAEFMRSESKDVSNLLKGYLSEGYSVAKSRTLALDKIRPDISNMLKSPNNILAVEYMKAGAAYGGKVQYHSVERKPDDGKKFLSSTKIRNLIAQNEDIAAFIPPVRRSFDAHRYRQIQRHFHLRNEVYERRGSQRNRKYQRGYGKSHKPILIQQYGRVFGTYEQTLYSLDHKKNSGKRNRRSYQGFDKSRRRATALLYRFGV